MVIELSGVQFSSEIILSRSFDFEITRMISDQIALHSVQLPLLINHREEGEAKFVRHSKLTEAMSRYLLSF